MIAGPNLCASSPVDFPAAGAFDLEAPLSRTASIFYLSAFGKGAGWKVTSPPEPELSLVMDGGEVWAGS